jgi:hypothetical protein
MCSYQFSSLYEIFTAANLAYALSDDFNVQLNTKVVSAFKAVEKNIINVDSKLKAAQQSMLQIQAIKNNDLDSSKFVEQARQKINQFETEFTTVRTEIENDIETTGLATAFKYLCFFNAMYCIFILFIKGFYDDNLQTNPNNAVLELAVFSGTLIAIIFNLYGVSKDRVGFLRRGVFEDQFGIGYRLSTAMLLIAFTVGCGSYWYFSGRRISLEKEFSCLIFVLTVLVPISHFLFYYFRAFRNSRITGGKLARRLQTFEADYNAFQAKELNSLVNAHQEMEKYKLTVPKNPALNLN